MLPNLNLLNFEVPQSKSCRYILTSPRSLKACKWAGIKPIDLLYKSMIDFDRELGPQVGAREKYHAHEKERQRRLEICRKYRNELLLQNGPGSRPSSRQGSFVKTVVSTNSELPVLTDTLPKSRETSVNNFEHFNKDLSTKKILEKEIKPRVECLGVINSPEDHHSLTENVQDINNNHSSIKYPKIRPSSSLGKKIKDKRKQKIQEYKKKLDKMKLEYTDPSYSLFKYKQIIENSIERELRELDVKRVQRQMEEGMEIWQDRVLLLQWLDTERAHEQSSRALGAKLERLRQKQRNEEILHVINVNKLKEEEDVKAELLRRIVTNKEKKILNLQQEKDRVIHESKSRAQNISEMKEQLRNILTPDTFDKKVTRFGFEKKLLSTISAGPKMMQRSHICVG